MEDNDLTPENTDVDLSGADFAKAVGKEFVIGTASTAGVMAGFVLVGLAYTGVQKVVSKFKKKEKSEETTPESTDPQE